MWRPVTGWCQRPVGISSSWPGQFGDMSLLTFPARVAFFHAHECKIYYFFTSFIPKWQIIWSFACFGTVVDHRWKALEKWEIRSVENRQRATFLHSYAFWWNLRSCASIWILHFIGFLCFARRWNCNPDKYSQTASGKPKQGGSDRNKWFTQILSKLDQWIFSFPSHPIHL